MFKNKVDMPCRFTLDRQYNVSCHGAFQANNWHPSVVGDAVVFTLTSSDGEDRYPGDVIASAKFSLDAENGKLTVEHVATASQSTPLNMAQNLYFNLRGHAAGNTALSQVEAMHFDFAL